MTETVLDKAFAQMDLSDQGRLAFFAALADSEVFLLLDKEAQGARLEPRLFPVDGRDMVLAFDTEARLAEFVGGVAAYAALPGRLVAQMLGANGLALGLNLSVAPSSVVLEPEALVWLTDTLAAKAPDETEARLNHVAAPRTAPLELLDALMTRLAQLGGVASGAILTDVTYAGGARGHLLAIIGAESRAEAALARAVNEALTFSGVEAGDLDVVFLDAQAPLVARLASVGLAFDIPQPQPERERVRNAPGTDPARPPKLK